jgi:hypothetical protein
MTTPMLMTAHPTEELLAQYIDDRLDSSTREPVTDHLASCGECREIVLMTAAFQNESVPVPHGNFGGRRWMAAVAGLAAAASIALIVVRPIWLFGYRVDDLVAASQEVPERTSKGRLAGGFPYAAEPKTNRGVSGEVDLENNDFAEKMKLYEIAADIAERNAKGKSVDPHVEGLSTLLIAKTRPEFDAAVRNLERALAPAHGAERDAIATDLAASLIGRARWSGNDDDYRYALRLSNDVLTRKQSPEALWNRAIATEALYAKAAALRAWDDYLKIDSDSPWAKEAMEHKDDLNRDP